jgi:protein TonB
MPSRIPLHAAMNVADTPEPAGAAPGLDSTGSSMPGEMLTLFSDSGRGAPPHVVAASKPRSGPVRVSAGVASGRLLTPIRPVYPAIAKAAHIQGTVVVEAVISRTGEVVNARAVSGQPMLVRAALDAITQARYQPYRLNGEAVEVETTINVVFSLN